MAIRPSGWDDLRFIEPRNPQPRVLTASAEATLDRLVVELRSKLDAWDRTLRAFDTLPRDRQRFSAAAERTIDRSASRIAADQPAWLTEHLGQRPVDVAGSRTWDNAVRAIARWELTHPSGAPSDPAGACQLRTWLAQTRHWLDTPDRSFESRAIHRTTAELLERRAELDEVLTTAPADCRHIIEQLQAGQLSLGDTDELLRFAMDQQGARREWILEHWPHVVEMCEVEATVTANSAANLPSIV